ncbi:ABC transporter ATP-binding protein [Nocardioides nanhaiensis]|uniref:ATP-binding cassette domain-containing protein n=1 Tax=Nocardioides nanhaiensis TaxID=1476871 RepID=A0ABP8W544_9ACTN
MSLVLDDVSYRYPRVAGWAVRGASLVVAPGEVVGLAGPSGCGKSTLGKLACGVLVPAEGRVVVDDGPARPRRGARLVQLVHQDPVAAMNPRWRVRAVLDEADPTGSSLADPVVGALVETGWLDRYPHEISGGELQRVSLARALLAKPTYLVADEISASLDPLTQAALWRDLLGVVRERGLGVLAVSHDAALLAEVADRVVSVGGGTLAV